MKNINKPCLFFLLLVSGCSSDEFDIKETDVPQSIISAFRAKYPAAQVIKWDVEKEDGKLYFEAEFKDGTEKKEIQIAADGTVTEEKD